ncbi:MAG: tRNA pseudouridine synthase [Gemmatimonadetes bacterium]|nr:tRNA pseudouridine synthase [Gemmatimonadota bacterium]
MSGPNGVIAIDKPVGPTSHDAVAAVRRALKTREVGHTGTLDPFASGLLLICVGKATRLAEYLTGMPKRYVATMRLGAATDTDDLTGETVSTSDAWPSLSVDAIREALGRQVGTIEQVPPAYSAKKVDGERMYAVARRGGEVKRKPVTVTIHSIDLLDVRLPEVEFAVECGSGTYIRAIARDVGAALGVGGHLSALRRTHVGPHDVAHAVPVDRLDEVEAVARAMLTPAEAVSHMPSITLTDDERTAIGFGRVVAARPELPEGVPVAFLSADGELLAIGERAGEHVRPRKVFA